MVAQLQPLDQSEETRNECLPGPRVNPRTKNNKNKRGVSRRSLGPDAWMKLAASAIGIIATIVGIFVALWQINPPPPPLPPKPEPRIVVDERATLTRDPNSKQFELHVNLTLLNEGGSVALIPRPTVLLGDANVPPNNLHFRFAEGTSEVIFPVYLSKDARTIAKQIICSIAEGHDGQWRQAGLVRINLDFRPEGHDPITHCLVVVPPGIDDNRSLSADYSKPFTITDDCLGFGDGFTPQRPFTKRPS